MNTPPTANWQLLPITCNARGNKTAGIVCDNKVIKVKLDETKAPFGAGLWQQKPEDTRLNLDLACNERYLKFLETVDEWAIDQLAQRSAEYFKAPKTKDEIRAIFKPSATPHEKNGISYAPTMRAKMNIAGANCIKCWSDSKASRNQPDDWRNCTLTPEVLIKGLYFMAGGVGVVYECHNIVVVEDEPEECPF